MLAVAIAKLVASLLMETHCERNCCIPSSSLRSSQLPSYLGDFLDTIPNTIENLLSPSKEELPAAAEVVVRGENERYFFVVCGLFASIVVRSLEVFVGKFGRSEGNLSVLEDVVVLGLGEASELNLVVYCASASGGAKRGAEERSDDELELGGGEGGLCV